MSEISLTALVMVNANFDSGQDVSKILTQAQAKANALVCYPDWVDENKVNRIRALRCFETVRAMLINGVPIKETAKHIQTLGELVHIEVVTISTDLEHYRATIPRGEFIARGHRSLSVPKRDIEKVRETIDCVKMLSDLHNLMMERIQIGMSREKALNMLLPGIEKNFDVCMKIIGMISEMQVKIIGDRVPAIPQENTSTLGLVDPVSRLKVARAVSTAMDIFNRLDDSARSRVLEKMTHEDDK